MSMKKSCILIPISIDSVIPADKVDRIYSAHACLTAVFYQSGPCADPYFKKAQWIPLFVKKEWGGDLHSKI